MPEEEKIEEVPEEKEEKMSELEEAKLKEELIRKYMKIKKIPREKAIELLEPIFDDRKKMRELLETLAFLEQLDTSKQGPLTRDVIDATKAKIITQVAMPRGPLSRLQEWMDRIAEFRVMMKLINEMFREEERQSVPRGQDRYIDTIVKVLGERINRLEENLSRLIDVLSKRQTEEAQNIIAQKLEKIFDNMQQQINVLRQELDALKKLPQQKQELTLDDLENLKKKLEALGFKLKAPGEGEIDIEKAKEYLAKLGYKIEPGWVSADQLSKLLEEERKKIYELVRKEILKEVEEKKVTAAENIMRTAIDKLFELAKPVLPAVFGKALGTETQTTYAQTTSQTSSSVPPPRIETREVTEEEVEKALKALEETSSITSALKKKKIKEIEAEVA